MIQQQHKQQTELPSEFEAACRREFDNDSILRAEFDDNFSTYLSYREAMASGKVRVQGQAHV